MNALSSQAPAAEEPVPAKPAAETVPEAAKPKPVAAQSQDDQLAAVRQVCTLNDLMAHCSWIAPNNPEILQCLKANASDLSAPCQNAVQSLPATAPSAPAAVTRPPEPVQQAEPAKKPVEPARTPAPAAPAPAAAAAKPSTQQTAAIKAACRSDFMSHCAGVQPGGAAALQCLQRNAASLSGGVPERRRSHRRRQLAHGRYAGCRRTCCGTRSRTDRRDAEYPASRSAGDRANLPRRCQCAVRRRADGRRPPAALPGGKRGSLLAATADGALSGPPPGGEGLCRARDIIRQPGFEALFEIGDRQRPLAADRQRAAAGGAEPPQRHRRRPLPAARWRRCSAW